MNLHKTILYFVRLLSPGFPPTSRHFCVFLASPGSGSEGLSMERWASAICLGLIKDPRALPALESLLLDGLDLEEYIQIYQGEDQALIDDQTWYGVYRWHAVQLLEGWDSPTLLSTFTQTFAALWQIQQHLLPFDWIEVGNYDVLAYALGQRGDLMFLSALEVPREFRNVAMIYLVLGSIQARAPGFGGLTGLVGFVHEMIVNDTLQQAVAAELASHFGLSLAEQEESLSHFYDDARFRQTYGHPKREVEIDDMEGNDEVEEE